MLPNTRSIDPLEDQEILSQAKDVLDRLILAVDILVSSVPVADMGKGMTADVLSQFDAVLLAEESDYFSDVHLTACKCDDWTEDRNDEMEELDVVNREESSQPFEIQMDENGNMDNSMAFEVEEQPLDEDLMGLLEIQSSDDEDADFLMVPPLVSGDGDEELDDEDDIDFIERMMLYFRETDLMLEEQQQGGGDHSLEPPIE